MLTLQHRRRYRRHYRHRDVKAVYHYAHAILDLRTDRRANLSLSLSRLLRVRLWNLKDAARGEPPQVSRYPHEYVCHGMNVHKGTPRVLATLHIHEFINRATRALSLVASGQFFDSDT